MPSIIVPNVPDEVDRALRLRAAMHGRSAEPEILDILERVVKPGQRIRLGDALADLGRRLGLTKEDFAVFEQVRDTSSSHAPPTLSKLQD